MRLDALVAGPRLKASRASTGDVLELEGGRAVRLAGIEAPAPGWPWGEAARATLERLAAGRRVDLLYAGRADDGEGRALAQVRVADGAWLEGALLEAGVARVRPRAGEAALAHEMLAREARARAARRGLWADPAYRVRLPDEFGWDDAGLQLVEGRVRRVTSRGAVTYLDFADDYRGVVSAEIPAGGLRDWRAAGLTPNACAAGWCACGARRGASTLRSPRRRRWSRWTSGAETRNARSAWDRAFAQAGTGRGVRRPSAATW